MEYHEIKLIKQSEKGAVYLVQDKDGEQVFIRKLLKGQHPIYKILQENPHPYLPKLYEVTLSDDTTTVIEEYIDGQTLGSMELSEKQFLSIVKELCCVLEFLHGKGIIHRDIKPSNMILAKDGHIRLIDFDAARMPKDDLEQDTRLLGTRGYAPPEQYGFSQTDERADIYALGVTLEQLFGDKAAKPHYKKIIRKCTDLNPDKRYQSVKQVKNAFFHAKWKWLYACVAILLIIIALGGMIFLQPVRDDAQSESTELTVLPVPENPHWDGESGMVVWTNVPESGYGDEVKYYWRLYRKDTDTPPSPDDPDCYREGTMRGDKINAEFFDKNYAWYFEENGFYFVAVCSAGDGIQYADSPYVISDAFEYTGESAPQLPVPTGLAWRMYESEEGRIFYATWSNLDDYEDTDSFNVYVYDKNNNYVMNNIWTKKEVLDAGMNGIKIRHEFLTEKDGAYRFTVEAYTSRPNEFRSSLAPYPPTEEYLSPWYYNGVK